MFPQSWQSTARMLGSDGTGSGGHLPTRRVMQQMPVVA
jgi:hypothetical protein